MRITLVAFGTRGEVQPYIALGVGLQAAGHTVQLVTIGQLDELVRAYGLTSITIPFHSFSEGQLTNKNAVPIWEMYRTAKRFIHQTLHVIWEACQDAEALIFNNLSRVALTHVVEALNIPVFMVIVHPYDLRFVLYKWRILNDHGVPSFQVDKLLRHQAEWFMFRGALNRWRKESLGLSRAPFWNNDKVIKERQIPLFCAYSSAIFPRRAEWPPHVHVTGYYFLDEPQAWEPPRALLKFLDAGSPPVYVGFGSLLHQGSIEDATTLVVRALKNAGQRGILVAGWSDFGQTFDLPDEVFAIESVPHAWLFPRVTAVVHHGGAGTTASGIRAGVPSILIPVAWDQPFWGQRVTDLGIGPAPIPPKKLTIDRLTAAITSAVQDQTMRARAAQFAERIHAEDGITQTITLFEQYVNTFGEKHYVS